ncbi:cuticle protein AMP1B-like [Eriocheir sinensis]|uniref:cuticle protein AMP1B-like n=1 Tax=Eriocheir sinensis TaxID=95602 RepID=UPI0021C57502|nr:cuticle protein AMP1B-like [Eriocheir sinensis]
MKAVAMMALLAVATAETLYTAPAPGPAPLPHPAPSYGPPAAILKDERVHPDAHGNYAFDVETEDGIARHESGGVGGTQQGSFSYTAPDGTPVLVKFVADDKGYQPESDLLPVAPAFPHPIPQFVLDQIAKAAAEDAAATRPQAPQVQAPAPSGTYGLP